MNLLKNLVILAVLAALGYGIYISLSPNNTDSRSSPDAPTVDFSNAKPSGPLPLTGSPATELNPPSLPSSSLSPPPLVASPSGNPSAVAPGSPTAPYPASGSTTLSPLTTPPSSGGSIASLDPPPLSNDATKTAPSSDSRTAPTIPPAPPANQASEAIGVRNLSPPPEVVTAGANVPVPARPTDDLLQRQFADLMDGVKTRLDEGKLAEAQEALSILYTNPKLPAEQAKQVTELLDQLAGTVIYSRRSYLSPPHVVQPGDTIDRIAQKCKVPWQLLARINGLMLPSDPNTDESVKDQPLPVGKELKVVEGPFDAIVNLDKRQLTLMVKNRYAGRFLIGIGRDQPKLEGEYTIGEKKLSPTYYGPDGITIGPNDPKNPLGGAWIGLTDRIGIHGAADPQSIGRDDNRGAICVSDRDLQDLYGILSVGSRVKILR